MTGQKNWAMNSPEGRIVFKEVTRNATRIELYNQSSNLALRINTDSNIVRYGPAKRDGTLGNNIQGAYTITRMAPNAGGNRNNNSPSNPVNNSGSAQRNNPGNANAGNQRNNPLSALEIAIFNETNKIRRQKNLPVFKNSVPAANLSRKHSQTMVRSNRLSHDGMSQRISAASQQMATQPGRASGGGENVIEGFEQGSVQANAVSLVQRWMASPGHKRNILNPSYTHLGVGAATGNGKYYATQLFLF